MGRAQIQNDWQEPWGDRRPELVFVGVGLEEAALRTKLDAALLTKKETDGAQGLAEAALPLTRVDQRRGRSMMSVHLSAHVREARGR